MQPRRLCWQESHNFAYLMLKKLLVLHALHVFFAFVFVHFASVLVQSATGFAVVRATQALGNSTPTNWINPLPAEWVLRALIGFTLSNARPFYSPMGNPLGGKGLTTSKTMSPLTTSKTMSLLSTNACNHSDNTIANGANSLSRVETAFLFNSDVQFRT